MIDATKANTIGEIPLIGVIRKGLIHFNGKNIRAKGGKVFKTPNGKCITLRGIKYDKDIYVSGIVMRK